MKKIWTHNDFQGHWPVGTAAVVIAETQGAAAQILDAELKKIGLPPCEAKGFVELPFSLGEVRILCDGDY